MAIKNKILYGYFLSFGIAIVGTTVGLWVGNYYQNKALESSQIAARERRLIGKIQVDVLYNRPAKQLSPYLKQPERFRKESTQLIKRVSDIYQVLVVHNSSKQPATLEGLQAILDEYQITVEKFGNKAKNFAQEVQPLTQTTTGAAKAEKLLVELVKSPEFVSFIEFPDRLSKFAQLAEKREKDAEIELEKAETLRTRIILGGLCLSILVAITLALYISEGIANPIQTLTKVAQRVTQESNFEIQASVNSKDEVGLLASSLNQLIVKVKQLLEENEKYTAKLEQAKISADTANQAKSEFLANMSHELRTPLNGVLGYSQILARTPLNEQQQRGIGIIYQSGFHLLTLINDILDLAKIEARKLELYPNPCYLPALLQGVVEISRLKAEQKSLDFVFQAPDNLPNGIVTDEKRLRQVLLNLLGNAIKFTDRGKVTFKVTVQITQQSTVKLHFQIIDTGKGISSEELETIFLPFEQVGTHSSQKEGTGLGLAISQSIVEMMGSSIKVNSQLETGSIFEFELECPLAKDWIEANTLTNLGKILGYSGKRRTILVVDDRWENRSVLVSLLEPLGFKVIEAEHGAEGMEKANQIHPDLIITDLKMPIMDGWQMLKQMSKSQTFKDTIVIVSSASVFEADRQKSFAIGSDDFLPKPVEAEELYRMLVKHLEIEWIYTQSQATSPEVTENNGVSEMLIPPVDELNALWKQVMQGQIKAIRKELENLVDKDEKYSPFIEQLKPLVQGFKIQELRQYLKKVMAQAPTQESKSV